MGPFDPAGLPGVGPPFRAVGTRAGRPERLCDFGYIGAQERIGRLLSADRRRNGGLAGGEDRPTSSARAASALLFGSMVLAKRTFAAVYSWPQ